MNPQTAADQQQADQYQTIEKIVELLQAPPPDKNLIDAVSAAVRMTPAQLEDLIHRWTGTGFSQFSQFLNQKHTCSKILSSQNQNSLTITSTRADASKKSSRDRGLVITYGFFTSVFGQGLMAVAPQGICWLTFVQNQRPRQMVALLEAQWPDARYIADNETIRRLSRSLFFCSPAPAHSPQLHLYLQGTDFQIRVWKALTCIPMGTMVTYETIANYINAPGANRAVGSAVGKNPVSGLIPCHRVIRKSGEFGNYGGGPARKKAMLAWEAAQA